jgi:hypothetical protein
VCYAGTKNNNIYTKDNQQIMGFKEKISDIKPTGGGTEYWALLVAVGVYEDFPEKNRPTMLEAVEDLRDALLDSPIWQDNHIRVIKGENATLKNLIKGLIWLILKEDKNDMSIVYITTHGTPAKDGEGNPKDFFPKDEEDGADEVLLMHRGFVNKYDIIWDDLLNFFLRLLRSKGICLIVDSCFAGGFNDQLGMIPLSKMTTHSFAQEFISELGSKRKVVLMSCEEDTYSYGSFFTNFLTKGFKGAADRSGNNDGVNSAEEAFDYAKPLVEFATQYYGEQHPTMLDLYSGDFPVTFS